MIDTIQPMMTNAELATAIAYAFENSHTPYSGGYDTSGDARTKLMQAHLQILLDLQAQRTSLNCFPETPKMSGDSVKFKIGAT